MKIYVGIVLASVFIGCMSMVLLYLYGIIKKEANLRFFRVLNSFYTKHGHDMKPFERKQSGVVFSVCVLLTSSSMIHLYQCGIHMLDLCKLGLLLFIVFVVAVIDWKYRIVPNKMIVLALIGRAFLYVFEFIWRRDLAGTIAVSSVIGFLFGFGFMLIFALVSRHSLGFGDVKIFGVIGLYLGLVPTYNVLLYSLIMSTVAGIYLLAVQKKKRKYQMPFGPSILIGYIAVLWTGMY